MGWTDPVEDNSRALSQGVIGDFQESYESTPKHTHTHTTYQKNLPQNQNKHPKQRNKNMKNEHFPSEMLHSGIYQIVVFFLLE